MSGEVAASDVVGMRGCQIVESNLLSALPACVGELSESMQLLWAGWWRFVCFVDSSVLLSLALSVHACLDVCSPSPLLLLPIPFMDSPRWQRIALMKQCDHAGDNRLESVPAALGSLTNLRSLHLETNQLRTIPVEVSRCFLCLGDFVCFASLSSPAYHLQGLLSDD
jgi:hypothetical protein